MYEAIIKQYLNRLSLKDINDFANKNGIILTNNEDKKIYDIIMKYWKDIYQGNTKEAFSILKNNVTTDTYNKIISMYNEVKDKIK